MKLPRVSLILSGATFLGFGVAFLVSPENVTSAMGVLLDRPREVTEVRAMYGGLEIGIGLFFLVATYRIRWIRAALGAQILLFGGLAGGRLVGMVLAPMGDGLHILLFVLELVAAAVGIIAFRQAKAILLNSRTPQI